VWNKSDTLCKHLSEGAFRVGERSHGGLLLQEGPGAAPGSRRSGPSWVAKLGS
jgi:hypothetical protein